MKGSRLPRPYRALIGLLPSSARGEYTAELEETLAAIEREFRGSSLVRRCVIRVRESLALGRAVYLLRRRSRHQRSGAFPALASTMELVVRDLRHALRGLARTPAFTVIVVLTLALGIGANTAIFTVVDAVLLTPLPYPEPERLMFVWQELTRRESPYYPSAVADIVDYATADAFEAIGGMWAFNQSLTDDAGPPERLRVAGATVNILDIFGVHPALGRGFVDQDGMPPSDDGAVAQTTSLMSWELWQRRYGGDESILGRSLDVGDGNSAVIVGIMPPGFRVLMPRQAAVPERIDLLHAARLDMSAPDRSGWFVRTVARLRRDATVAQAQAQLAAINDWQWEQFPVYANAGTQTYTATLQSALTAGSRPGVLSLAGAVAFVLLIACVNVANLLLVRANARGREYALRAALGAGRSRLARELMLESLVLSLAGGAFGLALAAFGMRWIVALGPAELPRLADARINAGVLAFTALACITVAMLCGLLVSLRASRPAVMDALRGRADAPDGGSHRLRRTLVVAEVALSLVLLVGAGLMVRSLGALLQVDLGFRPAGVMTFQSALGAASPDTGDILSVKHQVHARLAAIPGVSAVGSTNALPLAGGTWAGPYGNAAEVDDGDESDFRQANFRIVRPGYFAALGTPLLAGRAFNDLDLRIQQEREGDPPRNDPAAALVDDTVARRTWPGQDPLGKLIFAKALGEGIWIRVVGVVGTQRMTEIVSESRGTIYLPDWNFQNLTWALRTSGDPRALAPAIRAAMAEVDPNIPLARMSSMSSYIDAALAPARFASGLIGAFAALAVLLAVIGLYGVLSWTVRERTGEIGVRLALGATAGTIRRLVVRQGMTLASLGIVIGLVAAAAISNLIRSLLFEISPTDTATYLAIAVLFAATAAVACWLPARRATRVDPLEALRSE